jgi:hypothetical protein
MKEQGKRFKKKKHRLEDEENMYNHHKGAENI